MGDLSHPGAVMERLSEIEHDLALRQNLYEKVAVEWYDARREQGRNYARALLVAQASSVTEKKAQADLAAYATAGAEYEPEFEAIRSVMKVLETRAMILMSLLKAQGRA